MSRKFENKLSFETKDESGKDIKLAVKRPNAKQSKQLKKIWNIEFNDALTSGAILRAKVESLAMEQNLWSEELSEKISELQQELFDCELKLSRGGNAGLTKLKARTLALRMKEIRNEIFKLTGPRNSIDANTAEAQASNEEFNHQIALCTYWDEGGNAGQTYFKDYDDYIERVRTTAALDAGRYMALLQYNLDPNFEENLPENKFLKTHNFIDDKLRLIDKKGRLVDSQGRLVREDGRFVNEQNQLIDSTGNLVDEDGNYKVEFAPFLDDEEETGVESNKEEIKVVEKEETSTTE